MCELLRRAKELAKRKGLDPKSVYCPPDQQAICTGTECLAAGLGFEASEPAQTNQVQNFYEKVEKSLAEMKKHH